MTQLSVNINKIATIRNARGGNIPDVQQAAINCERFGAQGITVHPRPDGRHITYKDVFEIKEIINTEFNIEGYPSPDFMKLVITVKPHQVTLVPDPPDAITSNAGWDTVKNKIFLHEIIAELHENNIRSSVFIDTNPANIYGAAETGTNRIELYTEEYAKNYPINKEKAVAPFANAAQIATSIGLDINAGHDLNLENLNFFVKNVINIKEVSIGHALISDALYYGLRNTIILYAKELL
jgi:pyridoxine 5-phosphate synthase